MPEAEVIVLRFRASCIIGRVFTGWVFIGCSCHFEHRVFTGVFMGVHGSAGVHFFDLLFNSEATALMSSGQDFFDLRHCLLQRLLRVNHDIARGY